MTFRCTAPENIQEFDDEVDVGSPVRDFKTQRRRKKTQNGACDDLLFRSRNFALCSELLAIRRKKKSCRYQDIRSVRHRRGVRTALQFSSLQGHLGFSGKGWPLLLSAYLLQHKFHTTQFVLSGQEQAGMTHNDHQHGAMTSRANHV